MVYPKSVTGTKRFYARKGAFTVLAELASYSLNVKSANFPHFLHVALQKISSVNNFSADTNTSEKSKYLFLISLLMQVQ